MSSNGLLLPEKIDELDKLDVRNITVTLNAIDPDIGEKIYSFVNYDGEHYTGREGAEVLMNQQLKGIKEAIKRRMIIKINTVLIPTINDQHIVEIAKHIGKMGVYMQNIMPLIPQYKFEHITPPTPKEKREKQKECAKYVKQMRHCRQCRADAIGRLGHDVQDTLFKQSTGEESVEKKE